MLLAKGSIRFILLLSFWTIVHSALAQSQNDTFYLSRIQELFDVAQKTHDSTQLEKYLQLEQLIEDYLDVRHNDPQALYYLAYTKSRINSTDARGILGMTAEMVMDVSRVLEQLIQVEPRYQGKIISQDPYSKLSSEWGALALKYLYFRQNDSARWAFQEAKERGGYREYTLSINRSVLDACPKGSILCCSGDLYTLPLLYLQVVENYRSDVKLMDLNLLNTTWYPQILTQNNPNLFGLNPKQTDSVSFCKWSDSLMTIKGFSWVLPPSLNDQYLLRGDQLFLHFLNHYQFRTAIAFTGGMNRKSQLGLDKHLEHDLYLDLLDPSQKHLSHPQHMATLKQFIKMSKRQEDFTRDEFYLFESVRQRAYHYLQNLVMKKQLEQAKEVHALLSHDLNIKAFPPTIPSTLAFIKSVEMQYQNAVESNKN